LLLRNASQKTILSLLDRAVINKMATQVRLVLIRITSPRALMFNFMNINQFSGVNRTTNITTAAGATGANVFNSYSNLSITNDTRPAGSTSVLGTYFGEYNGSQNPRIIQLAVKAYF
jgi:hypothetical protein